MRIFGRLASFYAIATAVTLATIACGSGTAASAVVGTAPAEFFGMHYSGVGSGRWPAASVGSVRLWDTGTSWADIQPAQGTWDWAALDTAVATAEAHDATSNLVLGLTPPWASTAPEQWSYYGPGKAAPPRSTNDWWVYVHTVATRYKGRIASYEIWNEPDAATFWSGTISELVHLARVARNAVRRADPGAHLVSPGPVLRSGLFWARGYAAAGGYRYADVVAVHGYPVQGAGPEEGQVMIDEFRDELAGIGVRKPIWNSETNLETNVAESVELSVNRQSAYVVRLYLLSWAQGIQQVSWYDWSASRNLGVRMASRTGGTAAAAPGRAFSVVRSWMRGTMIGCTVSTNQTYRCDFTYRHGGGVVRWNPTRTVKVQAPPATVYRQNMYGKRTESRAATSSRVGYAPVLFRTSLRPSTQAGDPRARGESQTRIP